MISPMLRYLGPWKLLHLPFLFFLYALVWDRINCFGWDSIACRLHECCNKPHIHLDMGKLRKLSNRVYGQHLMLGIIESHLEAHFDDTHSPPKPLVLSFHGGTGTGKNYVTSFIVQSIFEKGMKSKFVHYYHVSKSFPHANRLEEYTKKLQSDIEKAVYNCERSIFIFDEFDHMPEGLIDKIKVYLDFHDNIDGTDYRKSIFFFLTNSGDELINDFTINYHMKGGQRDKIKLSDLEHHIARQAQSDKGGFHNSQLIDKHLVTAYIPFLPLQKMHIRMCINDELARRNKIAQDKWIKEILNELHFVNGFSESGCKRIKEKVAFTLTKLNRKEL